MRSSLAAARRQQAGTPTSTLVAAVVALLLVVPARPRAAAPDFEARVAAAIREAVQARVHAEGVTVHEVVVTAMPVEARLVARPAPGVRTGAPGVFSLTALTSSGPRRIGSAHATVRLEAEVLTAARDLARGERLDADDVVVERREVDGVLLKALPQLAEARGARVRRPLAAGAVVTAGAIALNPLVRSGQTVALRVVVGGIVATGTGVATQNGRAGSVIRLVNPDSRRTLVGRVTGPGEVEVIHGS